MIFLVCSLLSGVAQAADMAALPSGSFESVLPAAPGIKEVTLAPFRLGSTAARSPTPNSPPSSGKNRAGSAAGWRHCSRTKTICAIGRHPTGR
jgi:hypothetical protein